MIQVHDFDQGTPEWYEARRGLPTASEFATVLAKGEGKTRKTYLLKLAGEILTEELAETYSNVHMERGKVMEDDARDLYAFLSDDPLTRVGFISNGPKGCSPDALVGDAGILEIKTALPHILLGHLLRGEFPAEHRAQTQGALWVCEREWVDLAIYWPKLPLFVKRAYRDEDYIKNLAAEVDRFNAELADTVERVRAMARAA